MPESIRGTIRDIIYEGPSYEGGTFVIAKIDGGQKIKGSIDEPRLRETYRFLGDFVPDEGYSKAKIFRFTSYEVIVEKTAGGIAQYLRSHVKGIGPARANAVVEHFGTETLAILKEDPARIIEVDGITGEIAENLAGHFVSLAGRDPETEARLLEMFRESQFPHKLPRVLMEKYGLSAPRKVLEDPYIILDVSGVGWKLVDAHAVAHVGLERTGLPRHMAAIVETFKDMASDGHTCATIPQVASAAAGLLGMPVRNDAWGELAEAGKIVAHSLTGDGCIRMIALARYAKAEQSVATRIGRLLRSGRPMGDTFSVGGLAVEQAKAVEVFRDHAVSIITGAAGVGKTYVVTSIIAKLVKMGVPPGSILFVAPYGKSARRGAELLEKAGVKGVTCSTIHKALEPKPIGIIRRASNKDMKSNRDSIAFGFSRNGANPLEYSYIVISEGSTLPITLADSLFEAVAPGTRVMIDGDESQLASVGAGSFLRDIKAAGVPSFTLREIRRSDSAGTVVHACHAIRDGRTPEPADCVDLDVGKNWIHLEVESPNEIADAVEKLFADVKTFDPFWGMQAVCPQKKRHPFATIPLNIRLSQLLNPVSREHAQRAAAGNDRDSGPPPYFIGDKVIRTENGLAMEMIPREECRGNTPTTGNIVDYDWTDDDREPQEEEDPSEPAINYRGREYDLVPAPLVNGDMGVVCDVIEVPGMAGRQVVVEFKYPDRLIMLAKDKANLIQGYALTCHKCIGSGFDYVIIPVHHGLFPGLFTREWFYTAISRTQKLCVTVGPMAAIHAAIGRKTVNTRRTRLKEMLGVELRGYWKSRGRARLEEDMGDLAGVLESEGCQLLAIGHERGETR